MAGSHQNIQIVNEAECGKCRNVWATCCNSSPYRQGNGDHFGRWRATSSVFSTKKMELGLKVNQATAKLEPFLIAQNKVARKPATETNNAACLSLPRSLRKRAIKVNPPRPRPPIFVGLPLDVVSDLNIVNHDKAIEAGLCALSLLGVHGVDLPISWGIATDNGWSSYLAIAAMARDAGLRLRVSLNLHGHEHPNLPLPKYVSRAAHSDPDIFFTDLSSNRYHDCLSFSVDDLPVLGGRTPMEVYEEFFHNFRHAFSDFFDSTITDITVGLGPNGELRYPSFPPPSNNRPIIGVGEFQCYDKYMLADLKRHAEDVCQPFWGLGGPHDAPRYNASPNLGNNFFKERNGSWETPYGQFFLSWYSGILLSHGDRLLSVASNALGDLPTPMCAKVPFVHWWHNTRSRPSQLTAGLYNTHGRDGYESIASIFAKHSCKMIIPGIELSDRDQHQELQSSPESLFSQIVTACKKHGVRVVGENSSLIRVGGNGFNRIKKNLFDNNMRLDSLTYHRMGVELFCPENWPLFTEFVRSMVQPKWDSDDKPNNEEAFSIIASELGNDQEMQRV
ncbi:inactive beta-amylase 9-like [Zingiber officinale]|uniref:inactive beta-amylase 9-like n=1 Tax=Zingiber officinale TaxID=94328 RepID=UPI001C4D9496|nr:inactive beta-amylase 9-like [Zingiber officinale]